MRTLPLALLLACGPALDPPVGDPDPDPPAPPFDCGPDVAALIDGVSRLDPGAALPSRLVVHGDLACPVIADAAGRVIVATAHLGQGRVAVASHESLWTADLADGRALLGNAARWAGGPSPTIGVDPSYGAMIPALQALGLSAQAVDAHALDQVDVWITTAYPDRPDSERADILAWTRAGGGLLVGGHAWWWASQRGADGPTTALEQPGNRLIFATGLTISPETTSTQAFDVAAPDPLLHAGRAITAVEDHVANRAPLAVPEQRTSVDTVAFAARNLPLTPGPWLDRLRALLDGAPYVVPTPDTPIDPANEPIDALVVTIASALGIGLGPDEVFAIPAAFPGAVAASAPRTRIATTILASYAGMDPDYAYANAGSPVWRTTGAYAAPGEPIAIRIPESWVGRGLSVQIGAHTDTLWHLDRWRRHPAIVRVTPLDQAEVRVGSGFGGPVYVRVPAGLDLGEGQVVIEGAVAMPHFVLGQSATAFREAARTSPTPLVELEGPSFALTLPAADVPADLDATALMTFYEEIQAVNAWLAAIPERPRAERLAMDVQISAGWMHSGYPIMAYNHGPAVLDLPALRTAGDWGVFHELGHNHQFGPANLPGTVECTVNLWSVIAMEEVVGRPRELAHEALSPAERAGRLRRYLDDGANFERDWNVWTCLETWLQLQESFGWEPLRAINAAHRALPRTERPTTDTSRIADHVRRFSRETGRDLSPFYLAWGFPLTSELRAELADLPQWTEHPLVE